MDLGKPEKRLKIGRREPAPVPAPAEPLPEPAPDSADA
jgi:hypothetical protein